MKKLLALVLALTLCASLFAACAPKAADDPAPSGTAGDNAETPLLGEDGVFVVGFDQDFPPYGYVGDDGEFTGFDIECAKALAARLGWEIKLQPIDWDGKDFELESGTIDCIWNGFTMTGREDAYTWSDPYIDNTQVFVVKADSGVASLADLAGKTVAVQKDSSALAALNGEDNAELKASFGQLIEVGEYNTAFMDLEQGATDAIAMDIGVAKFQMEGREDEYVILDESLYAEQYGVGFLLGNTALRDAVNAEFNAMKADGTAAKIAEEFGVELIG